MSCVNATRRSIIVAAILTLGGVGLAQAFVAGWNRLLALPIVVGAAIVLVAGGVHILDAVIARAPGATATFSAALLWSSSFPVAVKEALPVRSRERLRRISAHSVGRGVGGYMDLLPTELRWRPGPWSRRIGFREFVVPWGAVSSSHCSSIYPGLGRLAALLKVDMDDGSSVQFWTRNRKELDRMLSRVVPEVHGESIGRG